MTPDPPRRYGPEMVEIRTPVATAIAAAILLLGQPVPSLHAGVCGDDVDGRRIACRCADIVVSDTTLKPDDPVVAEPCAIDGLTVRAQPYTDSITLDLAGNAIVGRGTGIGIQVDGGGSDGARVVGGSADGRGIIAGFASGVVVRRAGELARLEHLVVRSSRRDGISLKLSGGVVADVESSDNAGSGLRVDGKGGRFVDIVAERNGGSGIRLLSKNSYLSGRVSHNALDGVIVDGSYNELRNVEASFNGGRGIVVRGSDTKLIDTRADNNGGAARTAEAGGAP